SSEGPELIPVAALPSESSSNMAATLESSTNKFPAIMDAVPPESPDVTAIMPEPIQIQVPSLEDSETPLPLMTVPVTAVAMMCLRAADCCPTRTEVAVFVSELPVCPEVTKEVVSEPAPAERQDCYLQLSLCYCLMNSVYSPRLDR
ncbi:hypothetical protein M9458_037273, partial [Cirrhinus mrigala]